MPLPASFEPVSPYLDLQEKFMTVWKEVGLHDLVPLTFDDPDEEQEVTPYAKAMLERVGEFRYSWGAVLRVKCSVEIRIERGWDLRHQVEKLMHTIDRIGRLISGISEFRSTAVRIDRDEKRLAATGVEKIPAAWELWYDVENK